MAEFATTPPIPYVPIEDQAALVRSKIDAARLSAANSFGGLQKLAIPGPFATDAEANTFGVPDDNLYYRSDGTVRAASHISLDLAFALDKTLTARTGPTPTFTRASGATYVGSDGLIHGIDTSTTSVTFGTGSKTVTLSAPLGQDQMWRVGDEVEIVNSAGALMFGTVTSYTASTQELVCNITSNTGTGTFTAWRIGYRGARFDHDPATGVCKGLLIEESRENLLARSNQFNTSPWAAATVTVAEVAGGGLDGGSAWRLTPTGADSSLGQTRTVAVTAAHTLSVWLKSDTGSNVNLSLSVYDNTAGVSRGVKPVTVTTQWQRFEITASAVVAGNSTAFIIGAFGSWSTGENVLAFGAQLEVGAFPTSYIPTTSGTAIRSADVCSIVGDAFASFYNQSEGTIFASSSMFAPLVGTTRRVVTISDGTTSNRNAIANIIPGFVEAGLTQVFLASSGGTNQATLGVQSLTLTSLNRTVGAYKVNDFAASTNGSAAVTDTDGLVAASVNRLEIGNQLTVDFLCGHIARIQYFRKRLSNTKLQTLTTP